MVIKYEHIWGERKVLTNVIEANKGKHRDNCLCFLNCKHFHPGSLLNCERAEELYQYDVKWDMVTPVWECPAFEEAGGVGNS